MATILNDGYCKVCKVNFGKNIKNMESHLKGKKHIRSLPKSVTISGLSPNISLDDVNNYFSKFGKITSFSYNQLNNKITYSFETKEAMTEILLRNHILDGKIVELTWQTPSLSSTPSTEEPTKPSPTSSPTLQSKNNGSLLIPVLNHSDIIESLRTVSSFDERIKLLRDKLRSNEKDITDRCNQITNDIQQALRRNFPVCEIYMFGSIITQLDYLGSDLDIFIDKVKSTTSTEVQCLTQIKSKLYASRKFNEIILIRTAKVPIIKCKHILTKTNCDINIKNMLPVYNSQLINYYLTTDDRLHQLMIFIKYLFHLHDFKKNGYFSSYTLAWLFIFYLQQPPFCLPSVQQLENDNDEKLEDGWNCNFQQLKKFENSKLKQISIFEIFRGFLKFYTTFDYTTKVICPYLGKAVNRIDFFSLETVPDSFRLYKNNVNKGEQPLHINSAIVIQDPFEHNRNITAVTAPHCLGRFVVTCDVFLKDYLNSGNDSLITLLTRPIIKVQEFNVNFSFNYPQIYDDFKQFKSEFNTKIVTILKNILKFDISELNTFPQYPGVVGQQFEKIIGFKCRGTTNVWQDRMITLKNIQHKLTVTETTSLEKDIEISTQLIKNFSPTLNIGLAIRFIYDKQSSKMHCFIHSESNCKLFSYTVVFFRNRIIPWLLNQGYQQESIDFREELQQESDVRTKTEMTTASVTKETVSDRQSQSSNDSKEQKTEIKNEVDTGITTPNSKNKTTSELEVIGDSNKYDLEVVDTVEQEEDDEEVEDVPDDFFDAFSNADFMEGLDIVDAWDENAAVPSAEEIEDNKEPEKQEEIDKKKRSLSKQSSERSRHSKEHPKRSHDRINDDTKHRRLHSDEQRYRSRSRDRDRDRYRSNRDQLRRDPEKTRRDICKDKIKCARDQEMKLVSDKLKLVETGLVPPGTEMEVDVNEMESLKRQQHHQQQHTRSFEKEISSEKHRSLSSKRYNTSRDRHRSTSRDYSRKRRSGSIVRKRRGDSRHSDLSDREVWLREQRRTSRKRSRSESPATVLARKQDIAKRRSFLEEIREKLNEVNCPVPTIPAYQQQQQQQMYPPQPVPAPVPPPQLQQPQHYYQNQQYDQSYFIGYNGDFNNSVVSNMNLNVAQPTIVTVPITPINPVQYPIVSKPKRSNLTTIPTVSTTQKIVEKESEKSKMETSDVTKLFADKKISLSDFLTMTAKTEVPSSTPEHLQKKIKVISRCQDALKALSDDPNFVGRLRVKPTRDEIAQNDNKYKSPLRKIPIVRFRFTTRTASPTLSTKENTDNFASILDNVLQKIGVIRETVDLEETTNSIEDTSILAVKASKLLVKKNVEKQQTCQECEKRKNLIFSDVGTQCIDIKTATTIGIQVNEDDLQPAKASVKNSIAFLTPAQLLQKTKEKDADKRTSPSSPNNPKPIVPPSEFLRNFRQNLDVSNNWTRINNPGHPDANRQPTPYYQNVYNERMLPTQNYNNNTYDDYYRSRYGPSRY